MTRLMMTKLSVMLPELNPAQLKMLQALVASIIPDRSKPDTLPELDGFHSSEFSVGFWFAIDLIVGNATEVGLLGAPDSHSETAKPVNKQVDKLSDCCGKRIDVRGNAEGSYSSLVCSGYCGGQG